MQNKQGHEDQAVIRAKCHAIIDGHLHREVLREDDIRSWVAEVVGLHGEMAVWHAIRAGGFGGSEIGVLCRNFLGHRADHQNSAHDIVEGKLLRRIPDEESGHMRRGHDNEPRHAEWFYRKYSAVRDEEAFKTLSAATGVRPWMRYSPDELALLPADEPNPALGGRRLLRFLADYKAPSVVDPSPEVAFQYAAQLHQGAMICAKAGIHLDGLMLSQFDWAGWQIKDDAIPYEPELARLILQAGDHYWEHVLRGEVPRYVVRDRFKDEEALRKEWSERGTRIAQMKAMAKALLDQIDVELEPLQELLKQTRLGDTRLALGDLNLMAVTLVDQEKVHGFLSELVERSTLAGGASPLQVADFLKKGASITYDADAMAKHLRSQGVDLKPFRKMKFDDVKVFDTLLEHGQDPEQFMTEQLRMSPAKGLTEQAAEVVKATYGIKGVGVVDAESGSRAANDASGPQNDREGLNTERSAPRSVSA